MKIVHVRNHILVIPAEAGIQILLLDSRLYGNDR